MGSFFDLWGQLSRTDAVQDLFHTESVLLPGTGFTSQNHS